MFVLKYRVRTGGIGQVRQRIKPINNVLLLFSYLIISLMVFIMACCWNSGVAAENDTRVSILQKKNKKRIGINFIIYQTTTTKNLQIVKK